MPQDVKRRRYNSPRRQQQAAATRNAILAAAQELFEDAGYTATSVPAIAEAAGVALKTVYSAFDTKANLLRALWDARLAGTEAGIPVVERAWYRRVLEEPEPERKIRLLAEHARIAKSRSGALMEVIRNAATGDPEIAVLWKDVQTKLYDVSRAVIEQLHAKDALHADLDITVATDLVWTLNHPSIWHLLVIERRWRAEAYERWLGDTLCSQLLREAASDGV